MIAILVKKHLHAPKRDFILDVDIELIPQSFNTIFGKSGVGKTTLLRIIAGLTHPEEGRIIINDDTWLDTARKINLTPQKRGVGMVFQEYSLFPNMTVRENLEFALMEKGDKHMIDEFIDMAELGDLQIRKPETLSGGQRQRVALARALIQKPKILLLDEPLSALDMDMRAKLQSYIMQWHRKYNLTTILVSHNIPEIIKMSDSVMILDNGKISKKGSPLNVFSPKRVSGKFQFVGELIAIDKHDVVYVATVIVGNKITKIVIDEEDVKSLSVGDTVLVASKAFNPIIKKLVL